MYYSFSIKNVNINALTKVDPWRFLIVCERHAMLLVHSKHLLSKSSSFILNSVLKNKPPNNNNNSNKNNNKSKQNNTTWARGSWACSGNRFNFEINTLWCVMEVRLVYLDVWALEVQITLCCPESSILVNSQFRFQAFIVLRSDARFIIRVWKNKCRKINVFSFNFSLSFSVIFWARGGG